MTEKTQALGAQVDLVLGQRLRSAQVWVRHSNYAAPEPAGYQRDTAPFEAADVLEMQAREIERLRAMLVEVMPVALTGGDGMSAAHQKVMDRAKAMLDLGPNVRAKQP